MLLSFHFSRIFLTNLEKVYFSMGLSFQNRNPHPATHPVPVGLETSLSAGLASHSGNNLHCLSTSYKVV